MRTTPASRRRRIRLRRLVAIVGILLLIGIAAGQPVGTPSEVIAAESYDWLQFNGDPQHSGDNTLETILSSGNLASLGVSFQANLPSVADGAPVYLGNVATSSGNRDLLFVTTNDGQVVALDAHTGQQVWSKQYGAGTCRINNGSSTCYTTSSPVVDPNRQYVY